MKILANIADYVSDKINSDDITLEQYVTTDSLLQNRRGREFAQNLPPVSCALTKYQKDDVLLANIRPYLKKIWFADSDGGCSSDVLAFRAKDGHLPNFLYSVLMDNHFYTHAMTGAKGSKMPRGDKDQIMRYKIPISSKSEKNIGNLIVDITNKININRSINQNLEAMAKQLYDYWFVQFDFPDENGKPYKSSGGKMVWNEELKQEIPEGWKYMSVGDYAKCKSGFAFKSSDFCENGNGVIKIGNIQENYTLDMSNCQCIQDNNIRYLKANPFDIVIAMTGATIGKFAIVSQSYYVNQRVGLFDLGNSPLEKLPFLINSLKQNYFREQVFQIASGCAQPNISADEINNIFLLNPGKNIINIYNQKCMSIFNNMKGYILQIKELTKQRDELLPLLMNGQVTVNSDLLHD